MTYVCDHTFDLCLNFTVVVLQATKLSLHAIEDKPEEELPVLTLAQLEEISDPNVIINKMITLETQCSQMKPNLGAIAEYKKKVHTNMHTHGIILVITVNYKS